MEPSDADALQRALELRLAAALEVMRDAAVQLSLSIADYQYEVDGFQRSKISNEVGYILAKAKLTRSE
jgi:hypothetical protein